MSTGDVGKGKMWDPVWDVSPPKVHSLRAPRGTKRDRTREIRAQKIETAMAAMDDKVAQYRKETLERKPPKGIESLLKRLTSRIR